MREEFAKETRAVRVLRVAEFSLRRRNLRLG